MTHRAVASNVTRIQRRPGLWSAPKRRQHSPQKMSNPPRHPEGLIHLPVIRKISMAFIGIHWQRDKLALQLQMCGQGNKSAARARLVHPCRSTKVESSKWGRGLARCSRAAMYKYNSPMPGGCMHQHPAAERRKVEIMSIWVKCACGACPFGQRCGMITQEKRG